MKSPKAPKTFPTTTHLRAKDPTVLRAEMEHFRAQIAAKALAAPEKAALLLSEWLRAPARAGKAAKKSAA